MAMGGKGLVFWVACGLAASSAVHAQPPKPAACIWANTTSNTRAAMLARAPSVDAILGPITDDQAAGLVAKCKLPEGMASMVIVGQVLRANTLTAWSLDVLKSSYQVDRPALDAQWKSLPPVAKTDFTKAFTPAFKPSDAALDGLEAAQKRLNLASEEAKAALFDYLASRAILEGLDGG
jgi:hypothetical protein